MIGKIEWDDKYAVDALIDDQHKHLITRVNYLYDCLTFKDPDTETFNIVKKLRDEMYLHFESEEKFFIKYNFSDSQDHIRCHQELKQVLNKLFKEYEHLNKSEEQMLLKISISLDFKLLLIKHFLIKDSIFIRELQDVIKVSSQELKIFPDSLKLIEINNSME